METKKLFSIVMPAFNEESRIKPALEELKKVSFAKHGFSKEIIVVNDGSTDSTLEVLKGIAGIRLVSYEKNMGKGFAVRAGFEVAKGDVIGIQDADLEYSPADLVMLLGKLLEGREVVYGSRFLGKPKKMSFTFYFGNKFLSFWTSLLFGQKITDMETCQKVFSKKALQGIELKAKGFDIEPELTGKFLKGGHSISEFPISYNARQKAEKKITMADGLKAGIVLFRIWLFG